MKTIHYILYALATLSLVSCYDDKGNYDYTAIPDVVLDTVGCGIRSSYALDRFDRLTLEPKVKVDGQTADDSKLDYVWTMYSATSGTGADIAIDTLGHERRLDAQLTKAGGSYIIQLSVTNPANGIKTFFKVNCLLEEAITAGWMLLYEPTAHPGTSDVGLVVNPLVKLNIMKNREFWNIYSAANGAPIPGKPIRGLRTVVSMATAECIFATENTLVGVDNDTFEQRLSIGDFFFNTPKPTHIDYYGPFGWIQGEQIIMDGQFYTNAMPMSRDYKFGASIIGDYGELAPWAGFTMNLVNGVVYDQTNQRFLFVPYNGASYSSFTPQDATVPFDVNNVGMRLELADWGRNDYDYLLMSRGDERFLAIANFKTNFTSEANDHVGQALYNISASENIRQATQFVSSYAGAHVFYSAGNTLYRLYYTKNDKAEAVWTAPNADEEITCVRLQKFEHQTLRSMMMPNLNAVLHIATYNNKTGQGKLYQYTIKFSDGSIKPDGEKYEYNVPGRVKDMSWKWELVTS